LKNCACLLPREYHNPGIFPISEFLLSQRSNAPSHRLADLRSRPGPA
jgi:hypothetical protein